MTSTAPLPVAVLAPAAPPAPALQTALQGLPTGSGLTWTVCSGDTAAEDTAIVVCGPAQVAEATRRWPGAAIVTVVAARDDGSAVLTALDSGANVCVRGADAGLVAAYVHSVARRQLLLDAGTPR